MIYFQVKNYEFAHTKTSSGKTYHCASHCHNTYEIYLLLKGDVDYIVGNNHYSLRPFDLLVIPPSVFHCPHEQKGEYERLIFNFKKADVNPNIQKLLQHLGEHYYLRNNVFIRSLTSDFLPLISELDPELAIRTTKNLLELILIQLSNASALPAQKCINPTLSAIVQYIDENLDKKLQLKTLSQTFFVSESWVNYALKKYYSVNYSEYVKTKKMTYAQILLQRGESPKQAASMCGFDFYTTFLRQYKDFFGHLPSDDFVEKN